MKTRIHDVAERAGVSMKTVSRVLNREPNVSDATRDRVLEAARALRYTPSLAARGLATSKNYLLALLYDNVSPSYVLKVQQGATNICQESGYHLIVRPIRESISLTREDFVVLLERLPVDGVILTSPLSDNPAMLAALNQLNIRHVTIGGAIQSASCPAIGIDNRQAAEEMTRFLIQSGHKKIGFVKGDMYHISARMRYEGYKTAMAAHNIEINPEWVVQGDYSYTSGEVAARDIFSRSSRPTAIFASNDDMAAGVMAIAGHMGVSVPDDLSVGGFDDTATAGLVWPRLSTIRQPVREMGEKAAEFMIAPPCRENDVAAVNAQHLSYEHHLIIRESTRNI
ncbi:MAG: LacI family DNA-binding transcriptional regulator [Maricaulaceae bacterium]